MRLLRNAWYAAAFGDEVGDAPFARTLLEEPVVLFRDSDGAPAALIDRCPHRFAPLSEGKLAGGELQCPYHGLRFAADGRCVHNPHGKGGGAGAVKVRSFPVLERYGLLWVWPGDPERADPAALPRIDFLEQPDRFRCIKGLLHVMANYQLITDNLLDLSHASFLHPQFAGGEVTPERQLAATRQKLELFERHLVNHRMREGLPAPAATRAMFGYDAETIVHRRTTMIWHPPAILDFPAGTWALDEQEEDGAHIPQLHVITPETEFTSHYFFVNGRNRRRDDPEVDRELMAVLLHAFRDQDEPMIEAVQRRMGPTSDLFALRPLFLQTDKAPVQARRILERLIVEEEAG